jgi:diacylglycerol kinase family enzyme
VPINEESAKAMSKIKWDKATPEDKAKVLENSESIKIRKIKFDKPIAIIYNPNSGKKVNLMP